MELARRVTDDVAGERILKRGQLVILVACDSAYVEHAVALVRSLDTYSPGQSMLLHLVNPTDDASSELQGLRQGLKHTRLYLSSEATNLSSFTLVQRRTYYASVRFIRLSELLPHADCEFLVLDADSLVVSQIDRDFTDKPEAEICVRRRDLVEETPEHLAVAAGSVWLRTTERSRHFFREVADDILRAFEDGSAAWYLDQVVLRRRIDDAAIGAHVRNIKTKYADWEFRDDSIVWQAKGPRKYLDVRYLLLQGGLSGDRRLAVASESLYNEFRRLTDATTREPMDRRLEILMRARRQRVVFLLPRLDLPWKRQGMGQDGPPVLATDALEARLWWKRFLTLLANACERAGLDVELLEIPAWEITRDRVESLYASIVLVPHRCKLDFAEGDTPVLFFMQEYFRWLFVIDRDGWSASSSVYPVDPDALPTASEPCAFDEYRRRLAAGQLESKFAQPTRRMSAHPPVTLVRRNTLPNATERWDPLRARWIRVGAPEEDPNSDIPASGKSELAARGDFVPSIFFPMQIPHDRSIRYFSDFEFDAVLESVIRWGEQAGVVVMLKPHPANMPLMKKYLERYPEGTWVRWRDENIHDLIAGSDAVFTVNSGVGFEALLHVKPIVTFGRAEYDCVTAHAAPQNIDAAWSACRNSFHAEREQRYRVFFDWFMTDHAVDLSRERVATLRLTHWAAAIAALARTSGEPGELSRSRNPI